MAVLIKDVQIITCTNEDEEELESSRTAAGNVRWCDYFGKQSGSSSIGSLIKPACDPTILLPDETRRNEIVCPHKNLSAGVCSCVICNSNSKM